MGNSSTSLKKRGRSRKGRLSICEVNKIVDSLDGSCNTDVSKGVNVEVTKALWKQELTPSLLQLYQTYLFPNANSRKTIEEFADLYVHLVRGTTEEKARTLMRILAPPAPQNRSSASSKDHHHHHHLDEQSMTIPFGSVVKYVADLLESYLRGVESRKTREYLSWHTATGYTQENILAVAGCWCRDLVTDSGQVTFAQLERWVNSCVELTALHRETMLILYSLEPEDGEEMPPMLPSLMNPELASASVLDLAHILHLNFLLPVDFQREWRPLFSTIGHGESFATLLGKIVERGPTILVAKDEAGHVFGGFASHSWTLSPKFQGDSHCFLFSLQPLIKTYHPSGFNDHYMYLNYHQQSMPNGLGMGGQFNYWGLWLDSEFGRGECSNTCTTYNGYAQLSANKAFAIRHLEVWGVGPAPLTAEDKGERPGILDKDPAARRILEMAGKQQHSEGLRDAPPQEFS